ncbi:MAG: ABC transporter permease [Pseudomonadota bacterium]|jgi:peptide/nickel transport system permease protein|nr:ABC transporter permease [Nisaea sp.]MEC7515824.1 ABC transporter permease [Pseudomonadota bacterium]MEC8053125.1 ABC transporter permease [Pseudomonadota bacterium]MEC8117923.1 ABC transporter permease [Pseudomonadota bacterium]MEC8318890.1 ABC transporter permease [Pseudomonadota bacterium]
MSDATVNNLQPKASEVAPALKVRSYWQTVGYRLRYDYMTLFFGFVVILIILSAIFAPLLAPMDPYQSSMLNRLKPIGYKDFILGTDELGRDILSRILYGGRISLTMGILPVFIATVIGGLLGIIAGFVGGRTNMTIMRIMDVFYAFPSILLAVAISGALGGGIFNGMMSLTLVFIPPLCRVAETATSQVRNLDFVEAARATGASTFSIIRVHILGNVLGPILIYSSSLVSVSILIASGLSFLGLGVTPPEPDWGLMLNTLRQAIYIQPVICALPGVAILVTSICFNLVSDGLRSAMDVRM